MTAAEDLSYEKFISALDQLHKRAGRPTAAHLSSAIRQTLRRTIAEKTIQGWLGESGAERRVPRAGPEFEDFIDCLLEKAGTPPRQRPTTMAVLGQLRRNAATARRSNRAQPGLVGPSLYLASVREFLAPIGGLRHRGDELQMLEDFCRGDQPYLWVQGAPWAGKTALLSTFVANPPPDLTVIGFFVTNRLSAQRDHNAFTTAILDQLATLLPDRRDQIHTAAVHRDGLRAELLTVAAQHEAAAGRRLVLVVDGLDEDHGRPPIVSLLPTQVGDNLRVVISSRQGPRLPINHDHPLAAASRFQLTDSAYAADIRDLAISELESLLTGPHHHPELLALITAANGLTIGELEELTDQAPYEIHPLLDGVTGRSFRTFTSAGEDDHADPVYALAHESLFEIAQRRLGARLMAASRERLHEWAQTYRDKHWPPTTPEFLLRRYFSMLQATDDVERMVLCGTDLARRTRLLDKSGGDAAAFAEIIGSQKVIAAQKDPDVIAMLRLSIHRDHLRNQNSNIPPGLPAVWALLGQINRAEVIARSKTDQQTRNQDPRALTSVVEATAEYGDLDRAETIADSIIAPGYQASALALVAEARAETGGLDRATMMIVRAEAIADSIDHPNNQTYALMSVARAAVKAGDRDRAATLLTRAESIARAITDRYGQAYALVSVAETTAKAYDLDHAEAVANSITDPERQARALVLLVEVAAEADDPDRAETLAETIHDRYWKAQGLASAAAAIARAGDLDRAATLFTRAETIADSLTKLELRAWALVSVAAAAAKADEFERAAALITRAETIAHSISARSWMMLDQQARVLMSVADGAAKIGDFARAETIADSISVIKQKVWALSVVAETAAKVGEFERAAVLITRAESIARSIPDPSRQERTVHTLALVADAATGADDLDAARALIALADALCRTITNPEDQASALTWVASAIAKTGDFDRATDVVDSLSDLFAQATALKTVGEIVGRSGAFARAETLLARAAVSARALTQSAQQDRYQRARALESSVQAAARTLDFDRAETAAKAGDLDRAENHAATLLDSELQAKVLVAMAQAVARTDDLDRADALIARAEAITHTIHTTRSHRDHFEQARAVRVLALVAGAVATMGDVDRAENLVGRAEAVADSITDIHQQASALVSVAEAIATMSDVDRATVLIRRAETLAQSIDNHYTRARMLVSVAEATAKVCDLDRAESIANSIDILSTPNEHVQALLAATATQDLRCRTHAVARALRIADWHVPIRQLIEIAPGATAAVVAELDHLTKVNAS
ncbi:hypothetical protein AB0J48_34195 [Nocardia salmonicida]|uniref:hypothetical protein n=1 Tax=Nocardia salmonicida TaxID=53431 RepID=UPI00341EA2D3